MTPITAEYTDQIATPIAPAIHEAENKLLVNLYRYDDAQVERDLGKLPKARAWKPNMMFLYFATEGARAGRFVNPLDVEPAFTTVPDVCLLDAELVALHVDDAMDKMKLSAAKPLEHRLFTRAPLTIGERRDWANWVVSSAIDVFAANRRAGRDRKLQLFAKGSTLSNALVDPERIRIEGGQVSLSHGLWGHQKPDLYDRYFGPVAKTFTAPLMKSAGIPALVPTSFQFVTKLLVDYTKDAELRNLWQTKSLDFKVAKDADGVFGLRPGFWAIVDTDYVQKHRDLEGHRIDVEGGSFEIFDRNDEPIDAAYLVIRLDVKS
jgi:hypothetical protein